MRKSLVLDDGINRYTGLPYLLLFKDFSTFQKNGLHSLVITGVIISISRNCNDESHIDAV
jgi:hypothetical protein